MLHVESEIIAPIFRCLFVDIYFLFVSRLFFLIPFGCRWSASEYLGRHLVRLISSRKSLRRQVINKFLTQKKILGNKRFRINGGTFDGLDKDFYFLWFSKIFAPSCYQNRTLYKNWVVVLRFTIYRYIFMICCFKNIFDQLKHRIDWLASDFAPTFFVVLTKRYLFVYCWLLIKMNIFLIKFLCPSRETLGNPLANGMSIEQQPHINMVKKTKKMTHNEIMKTRFE